jgi:hypothetical protein
MTNGNFDHGLVIANLIGGIGNQMFQYAAGKALARAHGVPLVVDVSDFRGYGLHHGYQLEQAFGIRPPHADPVAMKHLLGWKSLPPVYRLLRGGRLPFLCGNLYVIEPRPRLCSYWDEFWHLPSGCYLRGYWQSEKYFLPIADEIRRDFAFVEPMSTEGQSVADRIAASESVSLHVRRGDIAANPGVLAVHGLCSIDYYQCAMARIAEAHRDAHFFVFSDDVEWARNNLPQVHAIEFVDVNHGARSYEDMRLMSLCRHHIVANSSFSWWGAWLGETASGLVVAPKRWFAVDDIPATDVVPGRWTRI